MISFLATKLMDTAVAVLIKLNHKLSNERLTAIEKTIDDLGLRVEYLGSRLEEFIDCGHHSVSNQHNVHHHHYGRR